MDRCIINHLIASHERTIYIRGLVHSFGFPKIGIPYERSKRIAGVSKFNTGKLLHMSIDAVVNQSALPLQYMFYFGLWGSVFLSLSIATYIVLKLFSITMNMMLIGILGLYVSCLYIEIKKRPISIIEAEINNSKV